MSESKTNRIENPDVANVVAYGTYKHENTAHALEKHGFKELADEERSHIDSASVAALNKWVKEANQDDYSRGWSSAETRRRQALVGEARSLFPEAGDAERATAQGESLAEPPQFKGVGPELTARAVGYLLTHADERPYMAKIAEDLGGVNQSAMSKIVAGLTEHGYVDQEQGYDYARRPHKIIVPTDKLRMDASEFSLWQEKVNLFELAKEIGKSDTETERYLVGLGRAMLFGSRKD